MEQKSARRIWTRIGVAVLIAVVLCTFLSRSIQTAMLPQVETARSERNTVPQQLRTTGVVIRDDSKAFFWPEDVRVAEVLVKEGQKIAQGDALLRIDLNQHEISCMEYENQILQIKNSLTRRIDAKTQAELQGQLAVALKRYETEQAKYPQDGILRAVAAGQIDTVATEAGKSYPSQTTLMTVLPKDAKTRVRFSMSQYETLLFGRTCSIILQYNVETSNAGIIKEKTVTAIDEVTFDSTAQCYQCFADVLDAPIKPGERVDITVERVGPTYDIVVPRSALFTDAASGQPCVYLMDMREGLFGKEDCVRAVTVGVIAQNDLKCSIASNEIPADATFVVDSTAPLTSGQTVAVLP